MASIPNNENPRGVGPDRLRIRLISDKEKTTNPEGVASSPPAHRRRASTIVASPTPNPADREQSPQPIPEQSRGTPNPSRVASDIDPSGGRRRRKQKAGNDFVLRLYDIIQSANDKEAVRTSVYAALYNNATMSSKPLPPSSKNAEIEEVIAEFEGDADLSSEIEDKLKQQGARRRKTKKSKKTAKKTRKYSRRR